MAAVNESNTFVFASMQMSELKASGWHVRKDVCAEIKLQNASPINETDNRHRVSTLYASLNPPKHKRQLLYTHMGQGEDINRYLSGTINCNEHNQSWKIANANMWWSMFVKNILGMTCCHYLNI